MTIPLGLPALIAGATVLLCSCASRYDAERVDDRTRALYGADSVAAEPSTAEADPGARAPAEPPMTAPGATSRGGDDLADSATLDSTELVECLDYALANSAELRAAYERWRAVTERVAQVSALPDPRLTYGEFLEEVQTRTGPQERRFGASQAFPWPGSLDAQADVAEHRAEAAWHQVEAVRLRVAEEVEVAYHDYAYFGRELEINAELLDLLRGLEPVVQGRVRTGGGQADLVKLQVEVGRLEDGLASLEARRPSISARLARAMHLRSAARALPLPTAVEPDVESVDRDRSYRAALERNPRLRELLQSLAAEQQAEKVAEYQRRPSFDVGVDYIQTGDALDPTTPGSGDDPVLLRFGVSLPVWSSSYAAAERESRHLARALREELDAEELRLRVGVEEHAFHVTDAARRIGLYRDSLLPRAEEALELTLTSYRTGEASVLDVIDSERALLEFEKSYWRACRDYGQGRARLRALTSEGVQ